MNLALVLFVALLLPVETVLAAKCVVGYIGVGKMTKSERSWKWAAIPVTALYMTYVVLLIYLITRERALWVAYLACGSVGTLMFLIANFQSYMLARSVRR
jgi:hypothetical protein